MLSVNFRKVTVQAFPEYSTGTMWITPLSDYAMIIWKPGFTDRLDNDMYFHHIPKWKFILHDKLFNMATVIQIKFHQDIMTHILMTIRNPTSKRSAVLCYLCYLKKVR